MSEGGLDRAALRRLRRPRLRVGMKFLLAVSVGAVALLAVGVVGVQKVDELRSESDQLFHNTQSLHGTAALHDAFSDVGQILLAFIPTKDPQRLSQLREELTLTLPSVQRALADFRRVDTKHGESLPPAFADVETAWRDLQDLVHSRAFQATTLRATPQQLDTLGRRTEAILERADVALDKVRVEERAEAHANLDQAVAAAQESRGRLVLLIVVALLATAGSVLWLVRDMVPRITGYSRFATRVAAGERVKPLPTQGHDELSELGQALNTMVAARQAATEYGEAQDELTRYLQFARSEDEAYDLLRRHLERTILGSGAVVLNRNNSADRLEPMTGLPPGSKLTSTLVGAEPRSCLAVRLGAAYERCVGQPGLVDCEVCGLEERNSTCQPLLVAGEVIGTVLLETDDPITDSERTSLVDTVGESAPILANLRNLAIAQFRAVNDALTGLPNKRAVEETLRRMVAQAGRTATPLAALMLDLDYFKQVNDTHGHGVGDDVLATIGEVLRASLRASDFAGRYGGEEFVVLLSMTDQAGAVRVAESIRSTVAETHIATLDRQITASLGVAVIPDDANDAVGLLRQADRALYAAKAGGRNQVAVAGLPDHPLGLDGTDSTIGDSTASNERPLADPPPPHQADSATAVEPPRHAAHGEELTDRSH